MDIVDHTFTDRTEVDPILTVAATLNFTSVDAARGFSAALREVMDDYEAHLKRPKEVKAQVGQFMTFRTARGAYSVPVNPPVSNTFTVVIRDGHA